MSGRRRFSRSGRASPGAATRSTQTAVSPALQPGKLFDGIVRDLTADGSGVVAHPEGQVFFVPGVWLGEQVRVRISRFKGRFGYGELQSIIEASPHRLRAPCPYHGFGGSACGGCPWQFVEYDAQLAAKQQQVVQALGALAAPDTIRAILAAPAASGYRNRAQLKTDGQRLGYLAANSHQLVDVAQCLVLTERNQHTLHELRKTLPRREWQVGRRSNLTTLDIDESIDADTVSVNQRLPFQQANSAQNATMRAWLNGKLQLLPDVPVLELFAGSGNFTEVVVNRGFTDVTAVEGSEEAMVQLRQRLPQVKTLVCNLFAEEAATRLRESLKKCQILLLDPPRDGLKNPSLKSANGPFSKKSSLRHLFYISCNLATFVRDLQSFREHGFEVDEIQPLDQFPHTPHIELMAYLRRR